ARPRCFIPVHGEFRHLTHHARLAQEMGVDESRVLLAEDGDVVELTANGVDFAGEVPAGYLYVDGIVGDVGSGVLGDRRVLASEGVVVVIVAVDVVSGKVISGPEVITRGWVYAPEADDLLDAAAAEVEQALEEAVAAGTRDVEQLERTVRRAAGR